MTKAHDPDHGPIEFGKPPSRAEFDRVARDALASVRARRVWPEGSVSDCPSCGARAFEGRNDLAHEIARPGGVLVYRHLRGARCSRCSAQSLEPAEMIDVEREAGVGSISDYEAKVSNIGSGTMGTYWPKDVVRVMALSPDKKVFIHILDRDTAILRFRRVRRAQAKGQKNGRGRKRT